MKKSNLLIVILAIFIAVAVAAFIRIGTQEQTPAAPEGADISKMNIPEGRINKYP